MEAFDYMNGSRSQILGRIGQRECSIIRTRVPIGSRRPPWLGAARRREKSTNLQELPLRPTCAYHPRSREAIGRPLATPPWPRAAGRSMDGPDDAPFKSPR